MKLKAGTTVLLKTRTDLFDHKLTKQDIIDIKIGDWKEVGFQILTVYPRKSYIKRLLEWISKTKI